MNYIEIYGFELGINDSIEIACGFGPSFLSFIYDLACFVPSVVYGFYRIHSPRGLRYGLGGMVCERLVLQIGFADVTTSTSIGNYYVTAPN